MNPTDKRDQPKITVYWLNESRSQRLIWLLEELGLDYTIEIYHRDKDMLAPASLQKIHPLGKAPILTIQPLPPPLSSSPNNDPPPSPPPPLVLAESGFIMQYLTSHFTPPPPSNRGDTSLVPPKWKPGQENTVGGETESYLRSQYFLHYPEGSLQPTLLVSIVLELLRSDRIPFPLRPLTSFVAGKFFSAFVIPHLRTDLAFLEQQLETAPHGGPYICGPELTAADILLSFPLGLVKERIGDKKVDPSVLERYPRLWAYLDRLRAEEGYQRAERRIEEAEKAHANRLDNDKKGRK